MAGKKIVIAGLNTDQEFGVIQFLRKISEIRNDGENVVTPVFANAYADDCWIRQSMTDSALNIGVVEAKGFNDFHFGFSRRVYDCFRTVGTPYSFFARQTERSTEDAKRLIEFQRLVPEAQFGFYEHLGKDQRGMPVPGSMFALLEKQLNEHIWQPKTEVKTEGLVHSCPAPREETPREPHVRIGTFGHSVRTWPLYR